jgi:hypothetical protein
MKRFVLFVVLATFVAVPCATTPGSAASAPAGVGAGPHGYDWILGNWSCVNPNPGPMSGPATSSYTASRANDGAGIVIHAKGKGYDQTTYLAFDPKTKIWRGPASYADGSYESESSTGTGTKVGWTGTYYSPSGAATKVRDNYTLLGPNKQLDVGQSQVGGTWKNTYSITCTRP